MSAEKRRGKRLGKFEYAMAPILATMLGASAHAQSGPYGTVSFSSVSTNAYGAGDVNSCSVDINNLITIDGYQFMAFYNNSGDVVLGRRAASSSADNTNPWTLDTTTLTADSGSGGVADDHHTISIAVDGNDELHVSWGMHNDAFNYAISSNSVTGATFNPTLSVESQTTMASWFPELSSVDQVTYPQFYNIPGTGNLLLLYRDAAAASGGGSGNGNEYFSVYNATTKSYSPATNVEAMNGGMTSVNAYINNLAYTPSGQLDATWTWRATANWQTNSNLMFAQSSTNGSTWYQQGGTTQYGLPIISSTADGGNANQVGQVVYPIPENTSYINQTSEALDANNNPFVATYWAPGTTGTTDANDAPNSTTNNPNLQYMLIYYTGTKWMTSQVSDRTSDTAFDTSGDDVRDLGRPLVMIDKSNRVIVVTRSENTAMGSYDDPSTPNNDIVVYYSTVTALDAGTPDWRSVTLDTANMGEYEPTYDPGLWASNNQLDLIYEPVGLTGEGQEPIQVLQWNENTFFQDGITWNNAVSSGGTGNGTTWDTAVNNNWNNGTSGSSTFFLGGDVVTFNDANNGHYAVTVNSTVSPASVVVNNSAGNYTFSGTGGIGGTGSLTKSGSSALTLSTVDTYTGGTILNAGTLIVSNTSGSATGTGSVTLNGGILASGATGSISGNVLAGTGSHTIAPGGVGTVGSLTIGGLTSTNLTTLDFDLGTGAGEITNGDLLTLGSKTVSVGSGTLMTFGGTPVAGDDYRLIGDNSGGTVVDAIPLANFSLSVPGATAGSSYSLSNTVDPGFIDLVVTTPANLTWNNAGGTSPSDGQTWDIDNNKNWNNGTIAAAAYADGANVTFNDANNSGSNANAYNVTLNTTVAPTSIVVNNTAGNYAISGSGTIAGAGSLTKSGTGTLTLSTANTYTGGTNVTAGRLVIEPTSSTTSALPAGALAISGNGIVQLADNVTAGTALGTSNVTLTSLSLSGNGTLDIGNNRIIIDYSSPATDPIASIAAWVKNGYYGLPGPAIMSSDIAADNAVSGYSYGIGYADGADGVVAGLPSGEIEIMFTLLGDANLDGTVNAEDFTAFSHNLGQSGMMWDDGDFNYDGTVNAADYTPFSHDLGQSAVLAAQAGALELANGEVSNVPEPASAAMTTMAGLAILSRRRRRFPRRQVTSV
jgi:autotransporter-associated beta strand protein